MKHTVTGMVLLALLFITFNTFAGLRFERFDSEHGLSQESITDIFQDSYGFIWIGTEDGLNRFDGYHFKVFRHQRDDLNSLSDNYVTEITQDSDGTLWVATYNGGLNRFDHATEQFHRLKNASDNPHSLPSDRLFCMTINPQDQLWLGLLGEVAILDINSGAQAKFSQLTLPLDKQPSLRKSRVVNIEFDFDQSVWIATEGSGLYHYKVKQQSFDHYLFEADNPSGLLDNKVQDVYLDSSDNLWIATGNGLSTFDRDTKQFNHFRHDPNDYNTLSGNLINAVIEDNANRLWVATSTGLNRFDEKNQNFIRYLPDISNKNTLTTGFVDRLAVSKDNVLWVGLKTNGLNKVNLNAEQFNLNRTNVTNPNALSGNIIWALNESHDGNLWIGTEEGGLNYFNRTTGHFSHYRHDINNPNSIASDRIYSVLEVAPGKVWIGTVDKGVDFFDVQNNKVTHYRFDMNDPNSLSNDTVLKIFKDSKQNLWVATRSGLNRFDPQKQHFIRYLHDENNPHSIGDNLVGDIFQSDPNTLWLATAGSGLNQLDITSEKFTRFTHNSENQSSIISNTVMAITSAGNNKVWLSTMGGLDRFDLSTQTFEHVLKLDHSLYAALQADDEHIWFNSNQGLSKMHLPSGQIVSFDSNDGLQSNEFNFGAHLKTSDGTLFFGGIAGLNYFQSDDIVVEQSAPNVTLTGLKLFNKPVNISAQTQTDFTLSRAIYLLDKLELSYLESLITLTFSSLDYANPEALQYQYKLDSDDGDWIDADAKSASATYTNLSSGNHLFMVRAKRKNGVWGTPTQLQIEVTPPPWRSWWAYSLYFLIIALVVSDFFYQRHLKFQAIEESRQQLADINENLDDLVTQRTKELSETLGALKNTQDALIESEKMSSLMGVVVGVAHEMNTPLGIATTALSHMRLDIENLVDKVKSKQLSRKDLEHFTQSGSEALDLASGNLHRSILLIGKFKTLSENNHQEQRQQVSMSKLLQHVIDCQHGKLASSKIEITLDCPDGLYLHTYPILLGSILEQLLENTIIHGPIDDRTLKVTISAYCQNGDIHLIYSDNGKGLESQTGDQLFEPFYTTKRGTDCTGLGLSIVYNQVIHQLSGNISYCSSPDEGLTLKINFAQQPTNSED